MRKSLACLICLPLVACASTYNLPEQERTRTYGAGLEQVWRAAVASVADAGLAVVETEPEHGRIKARAGGTIWDLKGHVLIVVVEEREPGRVRVEANVENVSESVIDFGQSERVLASYLQALDRRLQ